MTEAVRTCCEHKYKEKKNTNYLPMHAGRQGQAQQCVGVGVWG